MSFTETSFPDLLEILGYTDDEHVAICTDASGVFASSVITANLTGHLELSPGANYWFSVNPVKGPVRHNAGRGSAADVTRLAAVWADIDIKDGACRDLQQAQAIVDELSNLLGTRPSAVVSSGHGLQPYWPIDGAACETDDDSAQAAAILRRFGRLTQAVARGQGVKVDSVFDLPRVMRLPGTNNCKREPVPVTYTTDTGAPMTLDELDERLTEAGIYEGDDDRRVGESTAAEVSAPAEWTYTDIPCEYAMKTIEGWKADNPSGRHPWLVAQATRIAVMHRNRCLTSQLHRYALKTLEEEFARMCNRGGDTRVVPPHELSAALVFGQQRASSMNAQQVRSETGSHIHLFDNHPVVAPPPLDAGGTAPEPGPAVAEGQNRTETGAVAPPAVTLTDAGNADLMAHAWSHRLRYCAGAGRWLSWSGALWRQCPDDSEAITAARDVIETITAPEGDPALAKEIGKHRNKSLSRTSLESMVKLAKCAPAMRIGVAELDARPYELNTPDGIVNLTTGVLEAHKADAWHTRCTAVGFSTEMPRPRWHKFLRTTFGNDPELIGYVQRLAGYAATGRVTHHILPFLFGGGQNGKSVLMDVLTSVLGDYAITAPANFLLLGRERHETEIARLHGARLVVCSEVNQDSKFDESKVKLLTGGDVLSGRYMRQDFFDFKPTHTLFLMGNHKPQVTAGGTSFWRRLRLIPFTHTVPPNEANPRLAVELVAEEGPAILAWIAQGAVQAIAGGLDEPASVVDATADYAEQEDALGRFVKECCTLGGGMTVRIKNTVLLAAYQRWAAVNSEPEMSVVKLARELTSRFNIQSARSKSVRYYESITLQPEWMPEWSR
ncbi:MAG: DNA primase family protein [Mycobacterium sp.]